MQSIETLMNDLASQGVKIWLQGEEIRYRAPKETPLTISLHELRARRQEVIAFLRWGPATRTQQALIDTYARLVDPRVLHFGRAIRLRGSFSVERMRETLSQLCSRHQVLQIPVAPSLLEDDIGQSAGDLELTLYSIWQRTLRERFDVTAGPLMRVRLVRLAHDHHVLIVVMHHVISDAWSLNIVLRELLALYGRPELPAPAAQYADYARWTRDREADETALQQLAYWKRVFRGAREPFQLPEDCGEVADHEIENGTYTGGLAPWVVERLRELARRERSTVFSAALAAFCVVLSRWRGRPDVFVAVLHAGRHRSEWYGTVGCFVQKWVLRIDLSAVDTHAEALRRTHATYLESLPHHAVPYDQVKPELMRAAEMDDVPDIAFNYLPGQLQDSTHANEPVASEPGLHEEVIPWSRHEPRLDEATGSKLLITVHQLEANSLSWSIKFSEKRFHPRTIEALSDWLRTVLETLALQPDASL